ncbi:deoxyribose-phosphate aldolase [Psychroserpens ponticola]|uniref:Deoxyribose-phosphate aldolase n=1 Tax=Psychroserpens ponticola TaxID=2932268 RepID=A0ABY7RU40_9FLAO|nr:deoxyribose-phosphate aldolase [Psychroserpens ponticola]WCO00483.1 deoxyribose-phosphate aldolase [Psychroserpens ponticola]
MELNKYIDHTLLKSTATERDIIDLCNDAKKHRFYSVCVNSSYVPLVKQLLKGTSIKICTVVGFPLGASATEAKVFEAKQAIEAGAHEIDMVINIGFLKSKNYVEVFKDISDVKLAIGRTPLKVTIEISELSKNDIVKACEICLDAKANFVKTSTGFSKSGATLTAVKIMKKTLKNHAKIKALGGIDDYETAKKYIDIGVERLGTFSGIEIVSNKIINQNMN